MSNEKLPESENNELEKLIAAADDERQPEAQNQLGLRYQYGRGVQKNYDEAERYFQLAAYQGNKNAANNLTLLYQRMGISAEKIQQKTTLQNPTSGGLVKLGMGKQKDIQAKNTENTSKKIIVPIEQVENVNSRDEQYWTNLHYAARYNNFNAAITLIANGAEIDAPGELGETPLQLAASHSNLKFVKLLIQRGANVENSGGGQGYTPLLHALEANQIEIAKYLITECNVNIHHISDNDGFNALGLAMAVNSEELVELLLDRFAKFEPQHKIIEKLSTIPNSVKIYKLVLTKGYFSKICDFSKHTLDEHHAFFIKAASLTKNPEIVNLLLEKGLPHNIAKSLLEEKNYKGFDLKACGRSDVFSLLGLAMADRNETLVKSLLENSAEFIPHRAIIEELKSAPNRVDIYTLILTIGSFAQKCNFEKNDDACHAFFIELIFSEENENIIPLLLKKNLDPNLRIRAPEGGTTLLIHAIEKGLPKTTRTLLVAGAKPDLLDKTGKTALIVAAKNGYQQIVDDLLAFGANPNLANENGTTPLLLAVAIGNLNIIKSLLEKGANPHQSDKGNMTPLKKAEELGKQEILDALKATYNKSALQKNTSDSNYTASSSSSTSTLNPQNG